jgi:hypothetical protein
MRTSSLLVAAVALTTMSAGAQALTFLATDGSAQAEITSAPNGPNTDVTIVLRNTTPAASTTSFENVLTGISFAGIGSMSLTSQTASDLFEFVTGTTGAVNGAGPFDPSWAMVSNPPFDALFFDGFGSGGVPIIGPAVSDTTYANANSSLTSGPKGTYVYEEATFVLSAPGVFDENTLAGVTFRFNSDGDIEIPGPPDTGTGIPEPASLAILGLGGIALLRRRKA